MVLAMFRKAAPVLIATTLLAPLAGCDRTAAGDAAKGVAGFLEAVRRGDRAAFEAHVDRAALRADLRAQLADLGRAKDLDVDGGASEFALDRMITPEAFRLVQAPGDAPLAAAPTLAQVAGAIQVKDRRHVCLTDARDGRCALRFARADGVWRLTGMQAAAVRILALPPLKPDV
jgi:hypothetical protein